MFFNRSGQEQVRRYAIKKLSVGVASVCVGIGLAVCLPVAVFAEDMSEASPQPPTKAAVTEISHEQEPQATDTDSEALVVSEETTVDEAVVANAVTSNAADQTADEEKSNAPVELNGKF